MPGAYEDLILRGTPSLYWRLGASGGTDLSGNGRGGTAAGGVTIGGAVGLLAGDADAATDFDGTDDRITSTYDPFVDSTSRTFECWAWRDTNSGADVLFGGQAGDGASLYLPGSTQDVHFYTNNNLNDLWAAAWPGNAQVVHCVLTANMATDTRELFINGVSQGTQTAADGSWGSGNFEVGCYSTTSGPFDGRIDEVAVYERLLTPAEILQHYRVGSQIQRYVLRPNADTKADWDEVGAATAWEALDDAVTKPTTPATTDRVETATAGEGSAVAFEDAPMEPSSEVAWRVTLWAYAKAGGTQTVTLTLSTGEASIYSTTSYGWTSVVRQAGGLTADQVNALTGQVNSPAGGAGTAECAAMYLEVETNFLSHKALGSASPKVGPSQKKVWSA